MSKLGFLFLLLSGLFATVTAQNCTSSCNANTQECVDGTCICVDGYDALANTSPLVCADVDECLSGAAGCDADFGYCVDHDPPVKFVCNCHFGYRCQDLPDCKTCVVDTTHPCNINNGNCSSSATCVALANNNFQCKCNDGFTGDGETCVVDNSAIAPTSSPFASCATVNEEGSIKCDNSSSTCEVVDGAPTCVCNSGYIKGGAGGCYDIDECRTEGATNCTEFRSECLNAPGTYECLCKTGFLDFPFSIRGTNCKTEAELNLTLRVGATYSVFTGIAGIDISEFMEGGSARAGLITYYSEKFGIREEDIIIRNVTDASVSSRRKLGHDGRQLANSITVVAFEVVFSVIDLTVVTSTETAVGTVEIVERVNVKITTIDIFFTTLDGTMLADDGTSVAENEDFVQDYLADVKVIFNTLSIIIDDDSFDDPDIVVATTEVVDFQNVEDVSVQQILEESSNSNDPVILELAQTIMNTGVSLAPTASSSDGRRFLEIDDEEDFFGDFATAACKCLDCEPLSGCEDLWRGRNIAVPEASLNMKAHIVVSHCAKDLSWLVPHINGVRTSDIIILSYCGHEPVNEPEGANLITLGTADSSDDAFLQWVSQNYDTLSADETVLFLSEESTEDKLSSASALRTAKIAGFGCGSFPSYDPHGEKSFSSYCRTSAVVAPFWKNVGLDAPSPLIQVCRSSSFAASAGSLLQHSKEVWEAVMTAGESLTNIWAAMLSRPLTEEESAQLLEYSTEEVEEGCLAHSKIPTQAKDEPAVIKRRGLKSWLVNKFL